MSLKFYSLKETAVDKKGDSHIVTVVGVLEQTRPRKEMKEEVPIVLNNGKVVNGTLLYKEKCVHRKLTIGAAICHPTDKYDEELGIKIATSRAMKGMDLGSVETDSIKMLNKDAILAELFVKLSHICENIDDYLP